MVEKRSGEREAFDRAKVVDGVRSACKNRPVAEEQIEELARQVEDDLRSRGDGVSSEVVGMAVLSHLGEIDEVAYMRFASVYKDFEGIADFQREVGLLKKSTEPKRRS